MLWFLLTLRAAGMDEAEEVENNELLTGEEKEDREGNTELLTDRVILGSEGCFVGGM